MQTFRKKVRQEYAQHSHSFELYLDALNRSHQWCHKAQEAVRACTKLLLQKGVIRANDEDDADLVDLHMILRSMSLHDRDFTRTLETMDCGGLYCGSCGLTLNTALMSALQAVKNGRKDECKMCFQYFKDGRFELIVTCKHHSSA